MNRRLTIPQLKVLLRWETILLGLLAVAGVAWYQMEQWTQDAKGEDARVEQRLTVARDDLTFWEANYDSVSLEEEIEQLRVALASQDIPSHEEALSFRTAVFAYSAEQGLPLSTFERVESFITPDGEDERPVIHYSIVAQGSEESLVGVLGLLEAHPTAVVQELKFARPTESPADWQMTLELDLFYVPGEA